MTDGDACASARNSPFLVGRCLTHVLGEAEGGNALGIFLTNNRHNLPSVPIPAIFHIVDLDELIVGPSPSNDELSFGFQLECQLGNLRLSLFDVA